MNTRLILFDIDGTLLGSNGLGRMATRAAMLDVFGTASTIDTHKFSGKTDWLTLVELLTEHGHTPHTIGQKMPEYAASLAHHMAHLIRESPTFPLPHALATIQHLRNKENTVVGIISGNTSASAKVKLRGAGFDPDWFYPYAYGDEALDRNDLARLALKRAEPPIPPENIYIVGDTVMDVLCARAVGAVAVAVQTGYEDPLLLKKAQPDYLLNDLGEFSIIF